MNTIRQPCPGCGRTLELPANAVGKQGMCPACSTGFTIGQDQPTVPAATPPSTALDSTSASDSTPVADLFTEQDPIPEAELVSEGEGSVSVSDVWSDQPKTSGSTVEPATASSRDLQPLEPPTPSAAGYDPPSAEIPIESSQSPFSAPLGAGTIERDVHAPPVPLMQPAAQEVERLEVGQATIEQVVSASLAIFSMRWPPLAVTFLLIAIVMIFASAVPLSVIAAIADEGGDEVAAILSLIWAPVFSVMSGFVAVGFARVAIAVARNSTTSPMSEVIPPFALVLRFFVGALLLTVVLFCASAVLVGVVAGMGSVSNNLQFTNLLGVLATLLATVALIGLFWLLWPWWLIISDGKGGIFDSVGLSWKMTVRNKMTSGLLVLMAIVLTGLGTLFCNVGHFVTAPLTMLMFAVAYLLMTNQAVDTDRQTPSAATTPPSEPTF